jgi:hypothetical protein
MALFTRRRRVAGSYPRREVVYRDPRGPVRRLLGGIAAFIGWIVILLVGLVVLLVILL